MTDPLSFKGKKYISAKDAASLTGYTSDYVGQLARSGKIHSELVGRARYVDQNELLSYIEENAKTKKKKDKAPTKSETTTNKVLKTPPVAKVVPSKNTREQKPLQVLKDDKPLHPKPKKVSVEQKPKPTPVYQSSYAYSALIPQATLLLVVILIAFGAYSTVNISTLSLIDDLVDINNTIATASVSSVVDSVRDWIRNTFSIFVFDEWKQSVVTIPSESADEVQVPVTTNKQQEGIVVVPSTGDEASDKEIVANMQESFSDEVRVVPNEDGTSGLITPIFRDGVGQPFLYVIVPVEEEKNSSQP